MFIRPVLLHGSPLYGELYKCMLIELKKFENRLLRSITTNTSLQRSLVRHHLKRKV